MPCILIYCVQYVSLLALMSDWVPIIFTHDNDLLLQATHLHSYHPSTLIGLLWVCSVASCIYVVSLYYHEMHTIVLSSFRAPMPFLMGVHSSYMDVSGYYVV